MAAPETQFQSAGLNIPYNYTPVETKLNPPIQLPGTGELWANVGKTALAAAAQAGQMLQNSPLNPVVRAQMQEAQARAQLGTADMAYVRANPKWMHGVVGETPQGATMVAPITQPVTQQAAEGTMGGGDSKEKKEAPKEETPKKESPKPPTNLNEGMSQASSPSNLFASSESGIPAGYQGGGSSTAAQEGTPASMTFLNPATGNVEPLQTGPPPAQAQPAAQPQGGSIWRPPGPTPMAPPAPSAQQPPPQQSQTPAAASQADQAAMQKWQEQNAHPVMSSQDALSWMKNQTTLAQDATYLPMGGPGGAPAFAFHMKGGGQNIVPVSQMVQKGAGPLVAAQNTSQVISATDQSRLQPGTQTPTGQYPDVTPPATAPLPGPANVPQQPTGQVSGPPTGTANQPWGPPTQMPPTGQVSGAPTGTAAQPWGPPAAPTGPLQGQSPQIAQGGQVWNPQQPAPGPNAPPAPGDYNAAPYQQAVAQAMAQPSGLMAQEGQQAGVRSTDTAATDEAVKGATTHISGPDKELETRIFDWQKDPDDPDHPYAEFKDPQHPFWKRRYYMGIGMDAGPWTAENIRKQQLLEEFGGPAGVPLPKGVVLDYDTINGLSAEDQNKWLAYARDYKLHTKAPLPTDADGINLANNAMAVQAAQRIKDRIQYLKDNHIPLDVISQDELIRSQEAGWAAKTHNPLEKAAWSFYAGGGPPNNFADEQRSDYKLLNSYLSKVQGGHYQDAKTPKDEDWGIPATDWTPAMGIPRTKNVSTIDALNSIGSGDNYEQALAHIQEVLDNATKDYKNAAAKLGPAGMRTPDVDQKNLYDLDNKGKGYIDDKTNKMWDANHQKMSNPYGPIPHSPAMMQWDLYGDGGKQKTFTGNADNDASARSSPTPVPRAVADAAPRPVTQADYDAIPRGTMFWDGDGKLKPHP